MTALKGKSIDAFVARRDPKIAAVLVYGPDLGLVRERADAIARQVCPDFKDPFNYIELNEADLKTEPSRLADEAASLSMMGGERVVRIRTSSESATPAAKLVVEGLDGGHLKTNGVVVVEAGDLAKSSALRKLFETSKAAVALPCYADAPADIRAIAIEAARAEDLRFDEDALDLLVSLLGEDRGLSRSEIEKLILFKGPKAIRAKSGGAPATITLDDIRASLVDTVSDAAGEAASAAADGAAARLARALHRLAGAGASPIGTVRALQREFSRLRTARGYMAEGASAETAAAKLRPPVFFMEKRAFETRLGRWSPAKIDAALDLLLEAELGAKSTGLPDAEIVERAALRIAAMAGR
ncbi:MAG: DNA polymerase III subunit delta [Pseudomonadota bacterium]